MLPARQPRLTSASYSAFHRLGDALLLLKPEPRMFCLPPVPPHPTHQQVLSILAWVCLFLSISSATSRPSPGPHRVLLLFGRSRYCSFQPVLHHSEPCHRVIGLTTFVLKPSCGFLLKSQTQTPYYGPQRCRLGSLLSGSSLPGSLCLCTHGSLLILECHYGLNCALHSLIHMLKLSAPSFVWWCSEMGFSGDYEGRVLMMEFISV